MRDETKQPETYTTKKKKENWSKKSVIIVIMFVARLVKSSFRPILDWTLIVIGQALEYF